MFFCWAFAGRHLVSGHHGNRDGGWRAAILQRTAAQSHEDDSRQPAAQTEEPAQGETAEADQSKPGCEIFVSL